MITKGILLILLSITTIAQVLPTGYDLSTLTPEQIQQAQMLLETSEDPLAIKKTEASNEEKDSNEEIEAPKEDVPEIIFSSLESAYHDVNINHDFSVKNSMTLFDEDTTSNSQEDISEGELKKSPLFQIGYSNFNVITELDLSNGTVPSNYNLSIGDSFTVFIYGKKEQILDLQIDKYGEVFIPNIGPIQVAGLTLEEASKKIKKEFSQRFSNFEFKIKLNSIQKVNVTVAGDVNNPGVYSVNKFDNILTILSLSGGVKKTGSLRSIRILRNGKDTGTVDLYDLLIKGQQSDSIFLESNDLIFIPSIGETAAIDGAVKTPGIYELKKGESMNDLISFASGYNLDAYRNAIYVNRMDSDFRREIDVIVDKDANKLIKRLKKEYVRNGDFVIIKSRSEESYGYINISGNVNIPGKFSYKKGITLGDILSQAKGVKLNTHPQIQIYRFINNDERELFAININDKKFKLKDRDIIQVFNNFEVNKTQDINVIGEVKFPGTYKYLKNMTLSSFLLLAQPNHNASLSNIEITRYSKSGSEAFYLSLENNRGFKLLPGDKISVKLDNLKDQTCEIELKGEFVYPGKYRVKKGTRLSEVINKAGGYTDSRFLKGAIFIRKKVEEYDKVGQSKVIEDERKRFIYDQSHLGSLSMDSQTALAVMMNARKEALTFLEENLSLHSGRVVVDLHEKDFKNKSDNFIIQDGDTLEIPTIPESVHLIGGVQQSISIAYDPSYRLYNYVQNVGGYSKYADAKNIYIFKASGRVHRNANNIEPGDIIYVPERVVISFNWIQFLTNITSIISNAVTSIALIESLQ